MSLDNDTAVAAPAIDDCWSRIGVRGDASCPELKQHVHCRNCPVFGTAARQLLERSVPPGYLAEWTRQFAQAARADQAGTASAMLFRVGEEWLALPTTVFEEVAEVRPVHSLPTLRNGLVLGLVNVRGELLVCVSLSRMLGVRAAEGPAEGDRAVQPRMLVIRHETSRAVFPVDEVHGIERYHERDLLPPPGTVTHAAASYVRGVMKWRGKSVGVIDDQLLCYALNRSLSSATPL